MPPKTLQTYPNRPSRLLNLNKSPTKNKKISATNAARSPFLRLPPEVRGRIYDYAFGGNVVHFICTGEPDEITGYRLDICHYAQDHDQSQRIIHLPPVPPQTVPRTFRPVTHHDDCKHDKTRKPLTRWDIPLCLLQVCRQIYHEAALKPFSQTTFDVRSPDSYGVRAFLGALVPTQARAINHLQLLYVHGIYDCPDYKIMKHFKGLEVIGIQLLETFEMDGIHDSYFTFEYLQKTLRAVKDPSLKAFHLSMLVDKTLTPADEE